MEFIERRYGNHPDFRRVKDSLDRLSRQVEEELNIEKDVLGCYGEYLDKLHNLLNTMTADQISERYAELKSDLFSTSMAFFSSISEQLTQFSRRVSMRLRRLPTDMKRYLLNYMRDWFIGKVYPMLQSFIDKVDYVAKQLGVDSYSVSLNYAFISVGFTFKPLFKK
jgi:uncharacterized protein YPO0396